MIAKKNEYIIVFIRFDLMLAQKSKLYIPSTLNIDLKYTVAQTNDCVCRKC